MGIGKDFGNLIGAFGDTIMGWDQKGSDVPTGSGDSKSSGPRGGNSGSSSVDSAGITETRDSWGNPISHSVRSGNTDKIYPAGMTGWVEALTGGQPVATIERVGDRSTYKDGDGDTIASGIRQSDGSERVYDSGGTFIREVTPTQADEFSQDDFDEGHSDGYNGIESDGCNSDTYEAGHDIGWDEAFDEGHYDGYRSLDKQHEDAAYTAGYDAGWKKAYDEGYDDGYAGNDKRYNDEAYLSGYDAGIEKSYAEGESDGWNGEDKRYSDDAYLRGYSDGWDNADKTGFSDGHNSRQSAYESPVYLAAYEKGLKQSYSEGFVDGFFGSKQRYQDYQYVTGYNAGKKKTNLIRDGEGNVTYKSASEEKPTHVELYNKGRQDCLNCFEPRYRDKSYLAGYEAAEAKPVRNQAGAESVTVRVEGHSDARNDNPREVSKEPKVSTPGIIILATEYEPIDQSISSMFLDPFAIIGRHFDMISSNPNGARKIKGHKRSDLWKMGP